MKRHPLLQAQFESFIESLKYPDCTYYNLPVLITLDNDVDPDRLERAVYVIYDSSTFLHLRFGIADDGIPYQFEDKTMPFKVVRRQMRDVDFQDYASGGFCRPFDICGIEPLFRVEIVSTEKGLYMLADLHHLIMDGYSLIIFFKDIVLRAYRDGSLPTETYTVLDAADKEKADFDVQRYEEAKTWFTEKYADMDFATLSVCHSARKGKMFRIIERIDKDTVDNWCRAHDIAPNLLFQAAFSYTLSVLLDRDKIAYITTSHGRNRRNRNIVGMFASGMPVTTEIKEGDTVLDYIRRIRTELVSAVRSSAYPIGDLCWDLKKEAGIRFNFRATGGIPETIQFGEKHYPYVHLERSLVPHDILVAIFLDNASYEIRAESSVAMNSPATVTLLTKSIADAVRIMMSAPDAPIRTVTNEYLEAVKYFRGLFDGVIPAPCLPERVQLPDSPEQRAALVCAMLRLTRQDSVLVRFANGVPLVGWKTWLEKSSDEVTAELEKQYRQTIHHNILAAWNLVAGENAADGNFNFDNLLESTAELADRFINAPGPVCKMPVLSPEVSNNILDLGNGNLIYDYSNRIEPRLLREDETFVETFMRLAHKEPGKTVVIDSEGSYTREQLNLYSNKVAHYLIAEDNDEGSCVGILIPRSKAYLVLAMGVLKAGCTIVVIEEDYPEKRRRQIMDQAGIKTVLTMDTYRQILDSDIACDDICLCTDESNFQIFFTSGTTGEPKGVIHTMQSMHNWLNEDMLFLCLPHDKDNNVVAVRFSFVASLGDLWLPIATGRICHIIHPSLMTNLDALARYITDNNVCSLLMPASFGASLVNNYDTPLNIISLAAEKMPPIKNNKVKVLNQYGCTEALWIASKAVTPGDTYITCGKPLHGSRVYILDEWQNLLPQGMPGEICVCSVCNASGYFKNPELTAQKFIPNPFLPGTTLYRSGDLGYFDKNGDLVVMGRMDNMVKLRGYRIELDEISHIAKLHEAIGMCTCVKLEQAGTETLCLYYTVIGNVTGNTLKAFLSERLPAYMVPDIYMKLDKMPLSPNGKIDRKALPQPVPETEDLFLPETEEEKKVLSVVCELIGAEKISVTENLISLGLTSISAMRLGTRISKVLGKNVSVAQILSTPTVREIAANLEDAPQHPAALARHEFYPLTRRLQLISELSCKNADRTFLNIAKCYVFKEGAVDSARLADAFVKAIDATPVLKARLVRLEDGLCLQRRDDAEARVTLETAPIKPDYEHFKSAVKPFDPMADDWYRIAITTYGKQTYLFIDIFHLLADGISLTRFLKKVADAYFGKELKPDRYTFFDYILDAKTKFEPRDAMLGDEWYGRLKESCGSVLKLSDKASAYTSIGKEGLLDIDLGQLGRVSSCKDYGVTESNLFLAIVMAALQKISGREKFMLGIYMNIRYGNDQSLYDMVGYMLSVSLVGTDHRLLTDRLFEEARYLQEQTVTSYSLSHYSSVRMVERGLFSEDDKYIMPYFLFQDGMSEGRAQALDLLTDTWSYHNNYAQDRLCIEVGRRDGNGYGVILNYDRDYYSETLMERLAAAIKEVAENLK